MRKLLGLILVGAVALILNINVANAQTETPTVTPSPTSTATYAWATPNIYPTCGSGSVTPSKTSLIPTVIFPTPYRDTPNPPQQTMTAMVQTSTPTITLTPSPTVAQTGIPSNYGFQSAWLSDQPGGLVCTGSVTVINPLYFGGTWSCNGSSGAFKAGGHLHYWGNLTSYKVEYTDDYSTGNWYPCPQTDIYPPAPQNPSNFNCVDDDYLMTCTRTASSGDNSDPGWLEFRGCNDAASSGSGLYRLVSMNGTPLANTPTPFAATLTPTVTPICRMETTPGVPIVDLDPPQIVPIGCYVLVPGGTWDLPEYGDLPDTISVPGFELCIKYLVISASLAGIEITDVIAIAAFLLALGALFREFRT